MRKPLEDSLFVQTAYIMLFSFIKKDYITEKKLLFIISYFNI